MICKNCLGTCGRAASFAVASSLTLAVLGIVAVAQSAQTVLAGPVLRPVSPPAFLVAPSVWLGYSPTSIASGVLTSSGRIDLVTADYAAGKITVFPGIGQGSFAPGHAYAAGAQPTSVVIADLDGDGKADVVLANASERVISVFSGNGDGTLSARKTYAVGFTPSLMAVGDFTGNGKQDIAVAGAAGKTLAILQNDGTGNLKRPINFGLSSTPAAIVAGDFNNDGQLDLAIANASGTLTVLLGKGNGQFSALPDFSVAAGALSSIALGDFNRDGNQDLVVTASSLNQAAVLLGYGDGKFAISALLPVGNSPVATHVADVDGDGIPDLIVINKGSNTFSILNGAGDGGFKSAAHFVVGNAPLGAVAGDFYGNGRVDLATINQLGQTLSVPAGNRDGTFSAARAYAAGTQPVTVASGGLTKSGRSDLVVGNYCGTDATCAGNGSAAVLLGAPGGVYQLASTYAMGTGSIAIHLMDVDGDGKFDMVALNRVDKSISVRLGEGDGSFGSLITIPLSAAPIAFAGGNFSRSGKADLAVLEDCGAATCTTPGEVEILLGSGDGNFNAAGIYKAGFSPVALAIGATRTGGAPDVIVANRCGQNASCLSGGTASVLFGDGTGAFRAGSDIPLGNSPSSIALANLRGTGILDLVVSRSGDNTVAVLPGGGNGTFKNAVPYAVGSKPGALVIADFNGDGVPDVAVANTADSTVSVLFGRTDGTLLKSFAVPVSSNPTGVAAIAGPTSSSPASLATTNGSTSSPLAASSVTVVSNLKPRPALGAGGGTTASTTVLTSGTNPSVVNQGVLLTATVTGQAGSGNPSGNIVFNDAGTPLSDCGGATGLAVTAGAGVTASINCTSSVLTASSAGHSLTAVYLGDSAYDTSTSSTVNQVVNKLAGTLATASSVGASTTVGTSVTFTVTYTVSSVSPLPPTGNVSLTINGVASSLCPASAINAGQQATCTSTGLAAGNYVIGASYAGDTNFKPATAASINLAVGKASPIVGLAASPSPASVNEQVAFTATVPNPGPGAQTVLPGGSVTFKQGGTTICPATVLNTAVNPPTATCNHAFPSVVASPGASITATYSGDTNFTAGTNGTASVVVNATGTTTIVTSSGSGLVGQAVTFSTTVTPDFSGTTFPAGTVTFATNASPTPTGTCTGTLNLAGNGSVPSCTFTFGAAGTFNVTATFHPGGASPDFVTSTSSALSQIINSGSINVLLSSNPDPSSVNEAAVLSASFSPAAPPAAPTGTLTYYDGATAITNCNLLPIVVNAGVSTIPNCIYPIPTATSGSVTHSIQARYSGDGNYTGPINSNALLQVVNRTAIASAINALSSPSVNQSVTLTATLSPAYTGTAAPTGTVTFNQTLNGITTSPCANQPISIVSGVPTATCTTSFLAVGIYSIAAQYNGDANFVQGTAASRSLTVGTTGNTVAIAAPSNITTFYVNEGGGIFTATVTPSATGAVSPTGTMTFTDTGAGTTLCIPQPLAPNGIGGATASCAIVFRSAGSHTITATYGGDPNFPTTAGTSNVVVNATTTTTTLTSPGPVAANQPVTLSAAVTPAFPGTTIPKGTVTFVISPATTAGGTCTAGATLVSDGTAPTCTYTFAAAGTFNITATFTPSDANFATSSSTPLAQSVGKAGAPIAVDPKAASIVNEAVSLTAAFKPLVVGTQPTGSVTYLDGATSICSALIAIPGTIPGCSHAFTSAGQHSITVAYSGDTNFGTIVSPVTTQTVNQATTTAVVASSTGAGNTASSAVNQAVTFTATITPQLSNAALNVPTGTVSFYDNSNLASPICQGAPLTAATGGAATATCTYTFATTGTNTISAAYSGDSNFVAVTAANSSAVTQTVNKPNLIVAITPASSAIVNQTVTYTVLITPGSAGATTPTGVVNFTDPDKTTLLCAPPTLVGNATTGTSSASCLITFLNAGPHTISASYGGDTNFTNGAGNAAPLTVSPSTTSVTLTSGEPNSFATEKVTFVALVTPTPSSASNLQVPTGSVMFGSSDPTGLVAAQCPNPVPLTPAGKGTSSASCSVVFPHSATPVGQLSVTAEYTADNNFAASSSGTPQTVQDFNVKPSVVPEAGSISIGTSGSSAGTVYLTQGYGTVINNVGSTTIKADLFGSAAISIIISTSPGYNPMLSVTCAVYVAGGSAPLKDPSCSPNLPASVLVASNAGAQAFAINASTSAPIGNYTVRITTSDPLFSTTAPFVEIPLSVVSGTTASLSIAQGAFANQPVPFNTGATAALAGGTDTISKSSYSCPNIWDVVNGKMLNNAKSDLVTCVGPPDSTTISGDSTAIQITIQAATMTAHNGQSSNTVYAATLFGVPVLALLGWFGSRKSTHRNLYRFLGLLVLLASFSFATGCGGRGFVPPQVTTPPGIAPGTYIVQVIAQGASGNKYYAEVPITVVK